MDDADLLPADRWSALRGQWSLRDGVTYLNHGSFGPPPRKVIEARRAVQVDLDANPMDFFVRRWESQFERAATALGRLVGTTAENLVFVQNATTAMNVVARSFELRAGDEVLLNDHEYGAVKRIWEHRAAEVGAKIVTAYLPYPIDSPAAIVDALFAAVTPDTRLIVVSHVTSPTAVVMPVDAICTRATAAGIAVCIDGPHAVAMRDVDLDALDCDYYCASCHKWLSGPFGGGFLYVHPRRQATVAPLVRSWGKRTPSETPAAWRDEFLWPGTSDPSAYLAVPAAIEFLEGVGFEAFRRHTHAMTRKARQQIEALTQLASFVPDDIAWYGSMITLPLPPGDGPALQQALWQRHGIEVPIVVWNDRRYVRPSFHLYNTLDDLRRLVDALKDEIKQA